MRGAAAPLAPHARLYDMEPKPRSVEEAAWRAHGSLRRDDHDASPGAV